MINRLKNDFAAQFSASASHVFFSPGRVNLIGEHTDHNGGCVFPCALDIGTYALIRARDDDSIRMYSNNFPDIALVSWSLNDVCYTPEKAWSNYPMGVIAVLQQLGHRLPHGFDVLFEGNVPNGAGLSSSASIELCMAVMANHLYDLKIAPIELVKIGQRAENQFIGVNCGIMDQFACGMGRDEHAMLLDTHTLAYQYVPVHLGDEYTLLIANSNQQRDLASSNYNVRRAECEAALKALQIESNITALCALSVVQFNQISHLITQDNELRRARHAVTENERTLQAVQALNADDLVTFGRLMNESHISLRDDYEVTGFYLDALVQAAWDHDAVGARMTGAGFGGCTIMLVKTEQLESFKASVGDQYHQKTGLNTDFYSVHIGDGTRLIEVCE